jgi:hypothetical protein
LHIFTDGVVDVPADVEHRVAVEQAEGAGDDEVAAEVVQPSLPNRKDRRYQAA